MDNVFEVLIKKKRNFKDVVCQLLVALLGIAICLVAEYFIRYLGMISLAIITLAVWFTFKGVMAFNIEYEYTYVNGDIDIDRIFGKNTRRRLSTIVVDRIETVSTLKNSDFDRIKKECKVNYVCTNKKNPENLVIVYTDKNSREIAVIDFNERVYEGYKELIPLKVR